MTQEEKEYIISWFEHIAQIADDRKTVNGVVMEDWAALDEIKSIAKDSVYYIKNRIYSKDDFKAGANWQKEKDIKTFKDVYADLLSAQGYYVVSIISEINRLERIIKEGE